MGGGGGAGVPGHSNQQVSQPSVDGNDKILKINLSEKIYIGEGGPLGVPDVGLCVTGGHVSIAIVYRTARRRRLRAVLWSSL